VELLAKLKAEFTEASRAYESAGKAYQEAEAVAGDGEARGGGVFGGLISGWGNITPVETDTTNRKRADR
jgi:hypothetical protein